MIFARHNPIPQRRPFSELHEVERRYEELAYKMSTPEAAADADAYAQMMRDYKELTPLMEEYRRYTALQKDEQEAKEVLQQDSDPAFTAMVQQELCEIARNLAQSEENLRLLLIPKDADADSYTDVVLDKLRQFIRIAEKHDIVLLHENEKGIYGDTGARCKLLFDRLACPHFKAAFDFANFVQCEQDTAECWELLHDQIVYIHIKDALPGYLLNVPAGTGLGKIPELLRRAFCEEGYHGFLTLEPHLAMFDFFAPGAKGGKSQKLQFENNPIVEKMKSEMAEPGRPKDGAEAYATQYHALVEILNPILN